MENINRHIFKWNYKNAGLFLLLLGLPNLLGLINIGTPLGFKLHFFQFGIFVAAILYGPFGGVMAGLLGSIYSSVIMQNPYIAVGNGILGFFAGYFVWRGVKPLLAVWLGFLIQLPWLVLTDYFIVGLSWGFILPLIGGLLISNTLWAVIAVRFARPLEGLLQ